MTPSFVSGPTAPALCGALAGAGAYLALRLAVVAAAPPADGTRRFAGGTRRTGFGAGWVTRRIEETAGPRRAAQILLADDLAIVGADRAEHTAVRMARALIAAAVAVVLVAVASAVGFAVPPLAAPGCVLFAAIVGVLSADRPVRRRARIRRQEVALAVAAYVDLVRILLVGGLPFHSALRLAANAGHGWTFDGIREALTWSRARRLPPDAGLDQLAARIPLAEFRDLRLTVTSALRGASPVEALASKAVHLRATEAAQARRSSAVADADLELPAVVVALAFVAFLTFPLLAILTSTGTAP